MAKNIARRPVSLKCQEAAGSSPEAPGWSRQRPALGENWTPEIALVPPLSQGPMPFKCRPREDVDMAKK